LRSISSSALKILSRGESSLAGCSLAFIDDVVDAFLVESKLSGELLGLFDFGFMGVAQYYSLSQSFAMLVRVNLVERLEGLGIAKFFPVLLLVALLVLLGVALPRATSVLLERVEKIISVDLKARLPVLALADLHPIAAITFRSQAQRHVLGRHAGFRVHQTKAQASKLMRANARELSLVAKVLVATDPA